MLKESGVPEKTDLKKVEPTPARLAKGPVAIIECFQEIPCDPCYHSCKKGAIKPFPDINSLPEVDHDLCNGCGLCISNCPGLAIFVVDKNYSNREGLIKLPYEFKPLPNKGEVVDTVNRAGEKVGVGRIIKVQTGEKLDRTAIISIAVPKEDVMVVRHIRLRRGRNEG